MSTKIAIIVRSMALLYGRRAVFARKDSYQVSVKFFTVPNRLRGYASRVVSVKHIDKGVFYDNRTNAKQTTQPSVEQPDVKAFSREAVTSLPPRQHLGVLLELSAKNLIPPATIVLLGW